jgi:hypothetical protein
MDKATQKIKDYFIKSINGETWKNRSGDYKVKSVGKEEVEILYVSYNDFNRILIIHDNIISENGTPTTTNKRKESVQYNLFRNYQEDIFDTNTITGFKKEFLNAFTKIDQSKMNRLISMFLDGKGNFFGTGASSGKVFEHMFSMLIELTIPDFFTYRLDSVNNKNLTGDILISKSPKIKNINFINASIKDNNTINYNKLYKLLDDSPFLELSLKEYVNNACQISTQYELRELCEELIEKNTFCDDLETVRLITDEIDSITDNNKIIMSCQFFEKDKKYKFYIYEGFSRVDSIRNIMKKKHDRYELISNGNVVAHLKYGKKTANAFQRGLWVDDFNFFTRIYKGLYADMTSYSKAINKITEDFLKKESQTKCNSIS